MTQPRAAQSAELMCQWESWRVGGRQILVLELPPENYCDMGGAIRQAMRLMPDVRIVLTKVGREPDTMYQRWGDGEHEWSALDGRCLSLGTFNDQ